MHFCNSAYNIYKLFIKKYTNFDLNHYFFLVVFF